MRRAIADLHITYPVAIDNEYSIWRAFENQYWPAHYFIDAQGRVRYHHFGEGDYDQSERVIQLLLEEAGKSNVSAGLVAVSASGAEAASDGKDVQSPETYIGYRRSENFVSPGGIGQRRCARLRRRHATPERMVAVRRLDDRRRTRGPQHEGRRHRLSVPCARRASRAGTGAGRQADPVPRDDRRRSRRATIMAPMSMPPATAP